MWQDIFIGSGNGRPQALFLPEHYELEDGTVIINAVNEENGLEPWAIRNGRSPLPLGDFTPGASWSDCYFLGVMDDQLLLIAGNKDQGHSVYTTSLTVPSSLPTPNSSTDWVQTLRNEARPDIDFLYGIDLIKATDGTFYTSGALPRSSCALMHAPYSPAQILGDNCDYPNYVIKYSNDGLPLWQMGVPGFPYTADIPILANAPDAGIYLGSRSNKEGLIGNYHFDPFGVDAYVTRLSATGEVLWVKQFSLPGGRIFQMRSDQDGNAYLCGTFKGQLSIEGKSVSSNIEPSYFVAKFTPQGDVVWITKILPSLDWHSWAPILAFKVDAQNNAYIVLNYIADNYAASCGYRNSYSALVKLNSNGEIILYKEWESIDGWDTSDLDFTARGNIILIGKFRGRLKIDDYELESLEDCNFEAFVAKLTPMGEVIQVHILPKGRIGQSVISQEDDTYVVAGFQYLSEYTNYLGYSHYPFGRKENQIFISIYDTNNQLITERTFLAKDEFNQGGYLQLVAGADNQYVLQTENHGVFDTLAVTNSNNLTESNVIIAAFTLDYELPLVEKDGNLSASDLLVFPVPATDFVNIQTTDPDFSVEKVTLFNALGQEITPNIELMETGYYRLRIKHLPTGRYWLLHGMDKELVTTSFVKTGN